ncbi:MAG TPA: MnhB domain-containing protein [Gaiellales bacterium]|nr:MnhB domain-containing protein [Gaiellales bacterium]
MTRRARTIVLAAGLAGTATILAWGFAGLPDFGHYHGRYGLVLDRVAVAERTATNVPSAINFDYRALDTLGEEFILFSSALGVAVLLREPRGSQEHPPAEAEIVGPPPAATPLVRATGRWAAPALLALGVYIVVHGQLTPGGGFQGGVVVAGVPLLLYLCGGALTVRRSAPWLVIESASGGGAGGYALIGIAGVLAGGAFFHNLLPLGTAGELLSSGTIALASCVVGIEVAAAFTLVFSELAERGLILRRRP